MLDAVTNSGLEIDVLIDNAGFATFGPFAEVPLDVQAAAFGKKAKPEEVVKLGLAAFGSNRAYVVHGAANLFTTLLSRFVIREFTAKLAARLMRPRLRLLPGD